MNDHYISYWLQEAEEATAGQVPSSDPLQGSSAGLPPGDAPPQGGPGPGPALQGANQPNNAPPQDDVTQDPQAIDAVADEEPKDFEEWKRTFFKLAVKGDAVEMMNSLEPIRNQQGLTPPQRKFVEDN